MISNFKKSNPNNWGRGLVYADSKLFVQNKIFLLFCDCIKHSYKCCNWMNKLIQCSLVNITYYASLNANDLLIYS